MAGQRFRHRRRIGGARAMRSAVPLLLALSLVPAAAGAGADDDWQVRRSPFDPRLVASYRAQLERDPDDAFAWRRLVALYRAHRGAGELARRLDAELGRGDFTAGYLLGRLLLEQGNSAAAAARFEAALRLRAADPRAETALARLRLTDGKREEAEERFTRALAGLPARSPSRRVVLRQLADLASARGDGEAAQRHLGALIALAPDDLAARRELAESLARSGRAREALTTWREVAARQRGQPGAAAASWRRVSELAATVEGDEAALTALRRGLAGLPPDHPQRGELDDRITALYRQRDDLRSLIARLEQASPARRGAAGWDQLGRLHDELGDTALATACYRRAIAANPATIEVRRRLIALYDRAGREDEALAEHERLAAAAPGEPRYAIELAERSARRGEAGRQRALLLLARLGARFPRDVSVHAALADRYRRLGDLARVEVEQLLLSRLEPDDESHLIELGEVYWQRGRKEQALATWRQLPGRARAKATGLARLADVLADHQLLGEAVELYEQAMRLAPTELALRRGLAVAYERMERIAEAEETWSAIYMAARDPGLHGEARQRVVALAEAQGQLARRVVELRLRFAGPPPDDRWGGVLADTLLRLGLVDEAAKVWSTIAQRAATPEARGEAELALVALQRSRGRLPEAMAALERAMKVRPELARELTAQGAALALEMGRADEAVGWARRAVGLAPEAMAAQVNLAELLERQGDAAAAAAYARALALDGAGSGSTRLQLALARLHARAGQVGEALSLYRTVVLRERAEPLLLDAARQAIDLAAYGGQLGELIRAFTPLTGPPFDRSPWRQLLLSLYERVAGPLSDRARRGEAAAREELRRLGELGNRPLLEALAFDAPPERRLAARLLGELGNPQAAAPLIALATRRGAADDETSHGGGVKREAIDIELRRAAATAAARICDGAALAPLLALAESPERALRLAALRGLSRLSAPAAQAALLQALDDRSVEARTVAVLGLGRQESLPAPALSRLRQRLDDESTMVRAAAGLFARGDDAARAAQRARVAAAIDAGEADFDRLLSSLDRVVAPAAASLGAP